MRRQNSVDIVQVEAVYPYTPYEDGEIDQSIPERFEKQVLAFRDRLAIGSPEQSFTYDALNQTANRLARKILSMRGRGVEAIALLFDHGASALAAMLAVLKTGKFYVFLDPTYPPHRLSYMLADSGANLVITDTKNLPFVARLTHGAQASVNLDELDGSLSGHDLDFHPSSDELAALIYTSGSTGEPKGVMHTHKNVLVEVRNLTNAQCNSSMDRWLLYSSLSFANCVRTIYGALLTGGSVYPYDLKKNGFRMLPDWLLANKITIIRTLPTPFRNFMATLQLNQTFPDVRIVATGGEPIYPSDVEHFNRHFAPTCVLSHGIGPTECFNVTILHIPHGTHIKESKLDIGWPLPDKEVLLRDDSGQEAQVGAVGEIWVKSRYIALGYWGDPERTNAVFLSDPRDSEVRIYRTGDLGVRAGNGCLTHVGRRDFQVKIRGFRIDVSEIEVALRAIDGVKDAVVVGREDSLRENRLIAYFVPSTTPPVTTTQIRSSLAKVLPEFMLPASIVCIDTIPLTPNGKTDRLRLPPPPRERPQLDTTFAAPTTVVEKELSKIWAEVLDMDKVGIHDNFFELGGDSLKASRVIARVIQAFHLELSIRALFDTPTVAKLGATIA